MEARKGHSVEERDKNKRDWDKESLPLKPRSGRTTPQIKSAVEACPYDTATLSPPFCSPGHSVLGERRLDLEFL